MRADKDMSGFLDTNEIQAVLLEIGAQVEMQDVLDLMMEFDLDRSGNIGIDEFIALMTLDDDQFRT